MNPSNDMKRLVSAVCGAMLLLLVSVAAAHAQVHTIEVKEGGVSIDGQPVTADVLPPSFNAEGTEARFVLTQGAAAFLNVNGRVYRFSADGVQEVDEVRPSSVRSAAARRAAAPMQVASVAAQEGGDAQPEMAMIVEQAEVLRERARELERLSIELQQTRFQSNQLFDMIESIQRSAAETEQVARSLPHLQAQRYMQEMRERNTELYEQLVREQSLERETVELSQRIRSLSEGSEREELIDRLRVRLEEIFEMKQENRRREIEELEERLGSLQHRLEKRERYHDYIIEKRLNQLIGTEEEKH